MSALHSCPFALLLVFALPAFAADTPAPRALPLNAPTVNPAFVDVVTFAFRTDGERQNSKVVVTTSPTLQRIDEPDAQWSFIYDPTSQFYTGLEHSNYTYWSFSWPEVRAAVEVSKRGEKRLQDMSVNGLNDDTTTSSTNASANNAPDAAADSSTLSNGDDSGYVWKQTADKKRIAGLDCERWTGETLSGEDCVVWAHNGPVPKVSEALARLREVDEPITTVPVRTLVPDFIFPVCAALAKSGLTPVEITWGSDTTAGSFRLVDAQTRPYDAKLFTVPKLYVKTTLITLDGMIPEQPMPGSRSNAAPRVDHLAPNPTGPTAVPSPTGR